ncbi:amino acid ABC transporter substrate-binding protein [Tardiphaga sp.]|uniref:amino acid ABC transporter substrate-binding protein n=1 Tax=Tardiphaga sp. TaxID=1926292 RepID=UPI00261CF080|nr:amino acid ABC transporter substrate-binding protein [Tardiphaga sp.]MDB5616503.1 branched-chain amino acid transporter substrate-binding protein [Tardiphaga sp.]
MKELTRRQTLSLAGGALAVMGTSARAQSGPIKIGFGMALTGGLASGGKAALVAYQIWAEEVNARGGLLGRRVELVNYDDQSNPSTVPGIYSKLIDVDKVDIVVSGYGTVPTAAAMPVVMQKKKVFLSLFALAANDEFKYDRYFQLQPNGPNAKAEFSRGYFDLASKLNPKPQTVALVGADAEFGVVCLEGARENAKKAGIKIVYDRSYPPNTQDFGSIIRAIKATNPDLLFMASYPPDSSGLIRAIHEVRLGARMVGGGMIGLQFAALKQQLGPMLNNIVAYDLNVPEPTMNFPGVAPFLVRYRERAAQAGVDPLGIYVPPFAYAEMQILEQSINAVKSLDDKALADYMRATKFSTIMGDIKFGDRGEWADPRVLLIQYRGIEGSDVEQFKLPGKQVILDPVAFKSGELVSPFEPLKR